MIDIEQKYTIDGPFSILDFWKLPSATLYRTIHNLRQDSFASNHRIVFTCFDNLDQSKIKEFLVKLQQCVTFVDIGNCFILIASNQTWIEQYLVEVKQQWAMPTEDHVIEHKFYDVPSTEIDLSDVVAILNPPATVCAQPWISLDINSTGEFKPCCFFKETILDDNGTAFHVTTHSLKQVYNSNYLKDLRAQFVKGERPAPCVRCWNEERDGAHSKRMLLKHRFLPYSFDANWEQNDIENLKFVSFAAGNICNLKCRICNPESSSKIAEEQLKLIPSKEKKSHTVYQNLVKGRWIDNQDLTIWDQMFDSDINIEYFDISGGEPMLQVRHFWALQKIIDQGRSEQVQLRYNTNGTIFPDDYTDLWKKFKLVSLDVSIDNIQDRIEYERSGVEWDLLQLNLSKFFNLQSDKIKINLHLAISIQNVLYLPEMCDWIVQQPFSSVHFSYLYVPDMLNIGKVTPAARTLILQRLRAYTCTDSRLQSFITNTIDILKSAETSNGKEFCHYMKHLDKIRNQDFSKTHNEIAVAMGY